MRQTRPREPAVRGEGMAEAGGDVTMGVHETKGYVVLYDFKYVQLN